MKKLLPLVVLLFSIGTNAQEYFPVNASVKTIKNNTVAFTNATIYITPTQIIKKGTLLIKDGKVLNVGTSVSIPLDAKTIDLKGKYLYPSFIDIYSNFGIKVPKRKQSSTNNTPQYDAERKGYYWNDHIRPETNPITAFSFDNKKSEELLKAGFGVVNTHLHDGIIRGNGLLVALSKSMGAYRMLNSKSAQYLSFKKSNQSKQIYPNSLMGSMALLRQVYFDADWYAQGHAKNKDLALEVLMQEANKML